MKCQNFAGYEIIWGAKHGQSRFTCLDHINQQINQMAVVNTVLRLEMTDSNRKCQYEE